MATTPRFSNYISKRTGGPQSVLVGVTISGLDTLVGAMATLREEGPIAMGRALYAEGLLMMLEAKRLTPVRYGFLRASGHVVAPDVSDTSIKVLLGFGGPAGIGNVGESNAEAVGYALPVHENIDAFHPVGQAKFLEHPVLEALDGLESRLAIRIKKDLGL